MQFIIKCVGRKRVELTTLEGVTENQLGSLFPKIHYLRGLQNQDVVNKVIRTGLQLLCNRLLSAAAGEQGGRRDRQPEEA